MRHLFHITLALVFGCSEALAATPTLDSEQWAFLTIINNFRAQNGAGPLQVSVILETSSQWMSDDLATKNYFSHTDSLGRAFGSRLQAFGYNYYPAGENIAAGSSTAQAAFNQWLNACDADASGACTYAHRKNMMNAGYKAIGIGRSYNSSSTYKWYWVTDFGGVVDQPITPPSQAGSPTIASFTASPSSITAGGSATLAWSVGGSTSITIDNGVGSVSGLTSKAVSPAQTTTYTLTASNSSGSVTGTATVTVIPPVGMGNYSIWSASAVPSSSIPQISPVELGVKFRSDVAGKITGIRFYKVGGGVHSGSLWTSAGALLATGTFSNETASGWQQLNFATPAAISANTVYVASYHTNVGLGIDNGYFQTKGVDNGPLHALQTGVSGGNGVFTYSYGGVFPTYGWNQNYWVDVVFAK